MSAVSQSVEESMGHSADDGQAAPTRFPRNLRAGASLGLATRLGDVAPPPHPLTGTS
ncbi:MAG: hypothetical protein WBZ04_01850 [Candidatus Nanopelagicales bacterium]